LKISIAIAASAVALSLAPRAAQAGPEEYDRGYHDCRSGRFDEDAYDDSRSYRHGCRAAREEREGDERPQHHWRSDWGPPGPPPGPSGPPGPPPFARTPVPDIRGMDPVRALQILGSRGFRNVGTSVAAAGAVASIYFSPQTGECLQVIAVRGRVAEVTPSGDSRCR
jgi:hypothetical protein